MEHRRAAPKVLAPSFVEGVREAAQRRAWGEVTR